MLCDLCELFRDFQVTCRRILGRCSYVSSHREHHSKISKHMLSTLQIEVLTRANLSLKPVPALKPTAFIENSIKIPLVKWIAQLDN